MQLKFFLIWKLAGISLSPSFSFMSGVIITHMEAEKVKI